MLSPFKHLQNNSVNANFVAYYTLEENFHQKIV